MRPSGTAYVSVGRTLPDLRTLPHLSANFKSSLHDDEVRLGSIGFAKEACQLGLKRGCVVDDCWANIAVDNLGEPIPIPGVGDDLLAGCGRMPVDARAARRRPR